MRLFVDASKVSFMVTKPAEPKLDQQGQQQHRKSDGAPMWRTQVMALDEQTGGEVISVTVAGAKPEFTVAQMVRRSGWRPSRGARRSVPVWRTAPRCWSCCPRPTPSRSGRTVQVMSEREV